MVAQANGPAYGVGNGPSNETLPQELVDTMQRIFGKHPGYRTTHAKGLLVEGTFTPTEQAQTLSIAPHFHNPTTPVLARFSVGGGLPRVPDGDSGATPKGIAIRFQIDDDTHTDLITHSFNGFATRNGEDFLTFLQLLTAVGAAKGDPVKTEEAQNAFGAFLKSHPSAYKFWTSPKPNPFSYGTITYYEPNTHCLTNEDGKTTNVRYRLDPADGDQLHPEGLPLPPDYLEDDLLERLPARPIVYTIQAHIANADDVLDDATIPYKSTTFVTVGTLEINSVIGDSENAAMQQQIAFSPAPEKGGVEGITSSKDPLIQTREGVYWISSDQRKHEKRAE